MLCSLIGCAGHIKIKNFNLWNCKCNIFLDIYTFFVETMWHMKYSIIEAVNLPQCCWYAICQLKCVTLQAIMAIKDTDADV